MNYWNGKYLCIIAPGKAIPVKFNNISQILCLSVSASDARYVGIGGTIESAVSASYATTASYALNGGSGGGDGLTDIDGGNASSNYGGVIQSPIFGGNA